MRLTSFIEETQHKCLITIKIQNMWPSLKQTFPTDYDLFTMNSFEVTIDSCIIILNGPTEVTRFE